MASSSQPMEQSGLDPSSCADVNFLPYLPPTNQSRDGVRDTRNIEIDPLWVEAIQELDSDLHWLLSLPWDKFWSQVVYDGSLQKCLDSYLLNGPRHYDRPFDPPLKVKETLRNIHKRVFMTFLRMSTTKESESQTRCFSPALHSDLIYQQYLFDMPKLLDLCTLYSPGNKILLSKMVANVFKLQPKYQEDWAQTVLSLVEILKKVSSRVIPGQGALLLADQPKSMDAKEFAELLVYLADVATTLKTFLDIYPLAVRGLVQAGFLEYFVMFYESVVPVLTKEWQSTKTAIVDQQYVKSCFRQFKMDAAWLVDKVFHEYLTPSPPLSNEMPSSVFSLDGFISAVTTVFTEKSFLREYEKHFSLAFVIKEMQQTRPDLPDSHFDYIISFLGRENDKNITSGGPLSTAGTADPLVAHVKELLPHLGEGFIKICLKEFHNDPETVINCVLEDNLPSHLKQMDWSISSSDINKPSTAVQPLREDMSSDQQLATSLIETRESVYDYDEFDVFQRGDSVDLSKVQIGKKFSGSSAPLVLNDKSHLSVTRESYRQYENENPSTYPDLELGEEGDESGTTTGIGAVVDTYEFDQYSDEYDDTYDSHLIGAVDNDSSEEMFTVGRLNKKGLFAGHFSQFKNASDEDTELFPPPSLLAGGPGHVTTTTASNYRRGGPHFSKSKSNISIGQSTNSSTSPHSRGQSSQGQGSHVPHFKGHSGDVRTVDSERARQQKERNKGKKGNHNRKAMSDRKRGRGMGLLPGQ